MLLRLEMPLLREVASNSSTVAGALSTALAAALSVTDLDTLRTPIFGAHRPAKLHPDPYAERDTDAGADF